AGQSVTQITWSVVNGNSVAVSARPRLRFYQDNAGAPGTLINGFSFNPISFAPGANFFFFNPTAGQVPIPPNRIIWAGETFDDNTGTTGATAAQLDMLGQSEFNPPTTGTSNDVIFQTTAAGSFLASNPAGATTNFGGTPPANLLWQMQ